MSSGVPYDYLCGCYNAFISVGNWSEANSPNWNEHIQRYTSISNARRTGLGGGVAYAYLYMYMSGNVWLSMYGILKAICLLAFVCSYNRIPTYVYILIYVWMYLLCIYVCICVCM